MVVSDIIQQHFMRLSKGQRRVAQFIIDNPKIIATMIAADVGKMVGVSESTVIRLCYRLDFQGYSALQKKIREDLARL